MLKASFSAYDGTNVAGDGRKRKSSYQGERLWFGSGQNEIEPAQLAEFAKVAAYCGVGGELDVGSAGGLMPRVVDAFLVVSAADCAQPSSASLSRVTRAP
jgi:hypothetical protein